MITLAAVIWVLTVLAWVSAVVLLRATRHAPHIAALMERSTVAVGLALFGTVYSALTINNEFAGIVNMTDAVVVVRVAVIGLLVLPSWWLWIWLRGKLGLDEEDKA